MEKPKVSLFQRPVFAERTKAAFRFQAIEDYIACAREQTPIQYTWFEQVVPLLHKTHVWSQSYASQIKLRGNYMVKTLDLYCNLPFLGHRNNRDPIYSPSTSKRPSHRAPPRGTQQQPYMYLMNLPAGTASETPISWGCLDPAFKERANPCKVDVIRGSPL